MRQPFLQEGGMLTQQHQRWRVTRETIRTQTVRTGDDKLILQYDIEDEAAALRTLSSYVTGVHPLNIEG
jgi:hypothetical protein